MMTLPAPAAWPALLFSVLVGGGAAPEPSPPPGTERTMAGELTRVDLSKRSIWVKADGREERELEVTVSAETRYESRGRAARLEELRPGDRVVVLSAEDGG